MQRNRKANDSLATSPARAPRLVRALCSLGLVLFVAGGWVERADAAVEVEARMGRRTLTAGETTSLDVIVRGTAFGVRDPEFDVPFGLSVLGSSRTQSFSSINGQNRAEVVFRFEISGNRPGNYSVGPIRVQVGKEVFQGPVTLLTVVPSRAQIGSSGGTDASAALLVDVSPAQPYVGQPVIMRVRLVQRASLAEDPRYNPPATPGFWSERASQPESYYADQGNARVLVTETRTRLYPLGAGDATIAEASATLILAAPNSGPDPSQWMGGRAPRREVAVHSAPVRVRIRALPREAPPEFNGTVGSFIVTWRADRAKTSLDVPVTVKLEVRGVGNLPLVRTPALRSPDFEQFASTVEDSLAAPGTAGPGTRRFQWTVLPRRQGILHLDAPQFAWFDPIDGQYHRPDAGPVELEVGPPQAAAGSGEEAFPAVFAEHPVDPLGRGAVPWVFALAGLALGVAGRLWWSSSRPPPDQPERARQREWLHAVGRGSGSEFWSAAVQACDWLERRGRPVRDLRRQIEASRYGGTRANPEVVRRELMSQLGQAVAPPTPTWTLRLGATGLALAALILCWLLGPHRGDERAAVRALAADRSARAGDLDRARAGWHALWREGAHAGGVAARLAWIELRSGAIAPASLWALRGDRAEPRDPALDWVIAKIRETGGLSGFSPSRLPVHSTEWALLALLAGIGTAFLWPRPMPLAAAAAVLIVSSAVYPFQGWRAERAPRGVVTTEVRLRESNVALEPGQVVTVLEREGGRAHAVAGPGISGWIPGRSLAVLERTP